MERPTIGFAMCGSFCTFDRVLDVLQILAESYDIIPIMSQLSHTTDNRFGAADSFVRRMQSICQKPILANQTDVEPIGPKALLDALVIAPCTGNTLAKLSNGIADTAVTLAAKAHLRNEAPVVVAVSTNDGLGSNAASIGALLARRHFYFVPFGQDDPVNKPRSLVADFRRIPETLAMALEGRQLQPMLL